MSNTKQKPKQKFEVNFQLDITEQLGEMTSSQLVRLFLTIATLLPLSVNLMAQYQDEFKDVLRIIGSAIGDDIRKKTLSDEAPDIADLADCSITSELGAKYSFLSSFLDGLGGPLVNRHLVRNIIESIIRLVIPDYNSLIGWRDALVIYVRTHSKATIDVLSTVLPYPSYYQIIHFIRRIKPTFNNIREDHDVITAFDNEQKLKKSYRIGGPEGSNKMSISLCTMVIHLYPAIKTKIQFLSYLSPSKWLWNRRPEHFSDNKIHKETLVNHKECWWNIILSEVFVKLKGDESHCNSPKKLKTNKITNRRKLYEFAKSEHPDEPAEIEIGEPMDLNPSSYEDTKQIIRNISKKAGISKYGSGKRSWLAVVCDGSPYKLFLSLFNVLYFCKSCKLPCGELKRHIDEVHGGKKDSIRMEFDHVLPLCGPGHVEKNILSAAITVLWDLIGLGKIAAICNFKSKAQQDMLKKVKDHHISADFFIICLKTLAHEICFEFCKEWCKVNTRIPTYDDMKGFFSSKSKSILNVNLVRIFSLVNGPMLSTFMLRVGTRCSNGHLYYGAMSDCLSLLFHNKSSNYIRMLNFELYMVNNAPDVVKEFIFENLFQRNKNHNNQNTAQGIDYKLEEYNKLFKQFEVSSSPSIDDWTKIASAAPHFKKIIENQSNYYNIDYGFYSEPGAPDYDERIKACSEALRKGEDLKSDKVQGLANLDGKDLKISETLNYMKVFKKRKNDYLKLVTENNSFIKAELDFTATSFVVE